ncbi:ABC transporter permease [Gordonia sp. ABSL1-1]|uniref:ABC transporter permease n=1 Tax=Gordonia sp. ABSL1-1 TaxID=3053923 RepID=UPI0025731063|nr:ABC transporter permease [Gordonia sp. ABSL1-1]MDL9938386.1 ABC transporter permease [Gordonia sp. ABSL1-1]
MIATINAERIKLTTTRAPYWCLGTVAVLALGLAFLTGIGSSNGDPLDVYVYLVGLNTLGIAVLTIMAILGITSEYRFGTIKPTFLAVPKRWTVLTAKAVVYAVLAFVVVLVLFVVSLVLAFSAAGADLDFGDSDTIRAMWGTPVVASLYMVIAIALGALLRHTAGAVALALIWPWVAENIIAALPTVGEHVGPFLPFLNATAFLSGGNDDFHWGAYGSLAYFAGFTAILFGIAVAVVDKRDA